MMCVCECMRICVCGVCVHMYMCVHLHVRVCLISGQYRAAAGLCMVCEISREGRRLGKEEG